MTDASLKWYLSQLDERQVSNSMISKFRPKPDTGTLFINKFKKNDSHPDFTGMYAMPDGSVREVAGWQNGDYISLRFSNQYDNESKRSA